MIGSKSYIRAIVDPRERELVRFMDRVCLDGPVHEVAGTACWQWIGGRDRDGYGRFNIDGPPGGKPRISRPAHRVAYELFVGPLHDLDACHHCDNPSCVNPDHLFAGEQASNVADMVAKGRHARGARSGPSRHPDRLPRGDGHYSRTAPERLAWGDRNGSRKHPERMRRGTGVPSAKLSEDGVRAIRESFAAGATMASIAAAHGVCDTTVRKIVTRKWWRHVA